MSRLFMIGIVCVVMCPAAGFAQTGVSGYAVGGAATVHGFFAGGQGLTGSGGAEVLVHGMGAGAEIGLLGNSSSVLVVTSVNGVARLALGDEGKFSPFVTAGYTRMSSGEGSFDAWNIGAGANAWKNDHVGVRLEVRDHIRPDPRGRVQYLTARVGISFK